MEHTASKIFPAVFYTPCVWKWAQLPPKHEPTPGNPVQTLKWSLLFPACPRGPLCSGDGRSSAQSTLEEYSCSFLTGGKRRLLWLSLKRGLSQCIAVSKQTDVPWSDLAIMRDLYSLGSADRLAASGCRGRLCLEQQVFRNLWHFSGAEN